MISRPLISPRFTRITLVAVVVVWAAVVDLGARDGSKDWVILENCHFIVNPANDGDSFHASVGSKEYIFRLYLVDAAETDELNPARAFVQTKDGDLGEQLVRNGLARNYGFKAAPPGLKSSRQEVEKLQQLEDEARQEKIGGWGVNAGRLNVRAQKPAPFSVFVFEKSRQPPAASPMNSAAPTSGTPPLRPSIPTNSPIEPKQPHAKEKIALARIDINTATEKELKMIPGIGPVMAARIIAARPFRSADDLKRVSGIGDKKYAKIRPYFN